MRLNFLSVFGLALMLNHGASVFSRVIMGLMGLAVLLIPISTRGADLYFYLLIYLLLQSAMFIFAACLAEVPTGGSDTARNIDLGVVLLAVACSALAFLFLLSISYHLIHTKVAICGRVQSFALVCIFIVFGLTLCSKDLMKRGLFLSSEFVRYRRKPSMDLSPAMSAVIVFSIVLFLLVIIEEPRTAILSCVLSTP